VLLVVQSALSGPEETLRRLRAAGPDAGIVEHHHVSFGPVLRSRTGWLRASGLIEGDAEKEELVILRAVRL
jgi:release factor glutamine methyltransferase